MKLFPLLLLAATLLAQTAPKATKPARPAGQEPGATSKSAAVLPDDGMLNGHTYTSSYFRFSYVIPEGLEVVEDFMQGQEDAEQRSFVLLAAYSKPNADNVKSGVVIMADRAADYASLADGKAYLEKVTQPFAARQGYEQLGAAREYTLGGKKFFRADYRKSDIYQSFVFTVVRGYAVGFNLAAPSEAEVQRLFTSLLSVKFTAATTPKPATRLSR